MTSSFFHPSLSRPLYPIVPALSRSDKVRDHPLEPGVPAKRLQVGVALELLDILEARVDGRAEMAQRFGIPAEAGSKTAHVVPQRPFHLLRGQARRRLFED